MSNPEWPFRPDHVTSDGSSYSELRQLSGIGIITNEYVRGIQTSICGNLRHPTTLIEFAPDGTPARTDSSLLMFSLRPVCSVFRQHTENVFCYTCDNEHAGLFRGLNRLNFAMDVKKRIAVNPYIQQYIREPGVQFELQEVNGRPYLEYDCPLMGYRELLFPVFFEEKVLAAFFVGQIILDAKREFISDRQDLFFKRNPYCFDRFIRLHPENDASKIISIIYRKHFEWVNNESNVFKEQRYQNLINSADVELISFEQTLKDQGKLKRELYVRTNMSRFSRDFQEGLPTELPPGGQVLLEQFWENLEKQLIEIVKCFSLKYIVVFGIRSYPDVERRLLGVVSSAGALPAAIKDNRERVQLDLGQMPSNMESIRIASWWNDSKLFKGIPPGSTDQLQAETSIASVFSPPFLAYGAFAVFVGYSDANPSSSIENLADGYFSTSLNSFFTLVGSVLSSILVSIAHSSMETAFRVLGHEVGQLTIGLDWLRLTYLSNVNKLRKIPYKKARDLSRDFEGFFRQVHFLSETADRAISERLELNKTYFLAFRELLFKWKDTYRLEAKYKHLQFDVYYPRRQDRKRSPVYGDPILLEQMVYNLVSNAVKYCYRGTKIFMDCVKKDPYDASSPHILTVADYGLSIDCDEKCYELYYRGKNIPHEADGLGIGLYVARKIIQVHGGTITHSCELISEFNVPLIEAYLRWDGADKDLFPYLQEEIIRLKQQGKYQATVALDTSGSLRFANPYPDELKNSIRRATWKVTFEAIIPAEDKE